MTLANSGGTAIIVGGSERRNYESSWFEKCSSSKFRLTINMGFYRLPDKTILSSLIEKDQFLALLLLSRCLRKSLMTLNLRAECEMRHFNEPNVSQIRQPQRIS